MAPVNDLINQEVLMIDIALTANGYFDAALGAPQ